MKIFVFFWRGSSLNFGDGITYFPLKYFRILNASGQVCKSVPHAKFYGLRSGYNKHKTYWFDKNILGNLVPTCPGNWTDYYNRDLPSGMGDFETLASLRRENPGEICKYPIAVDARLVDDHTHYTLTGQNLNVDLELGFYCVNEEQTEEECLNYEARFCCNGNFAYTEICGMFVV